MHGINIYNHADARFDDLELEHGHNRSAEENNNYAMAIQTAHDGSCADARFDGLDPDYKVTLDRQRTTIVKLQHLN